MSTKWSKIKIYHSGMANSNASFCKSVVKYLKKLKMVLDKMKPATPFFTTKKSTTWVNRSISWWVLSSFTFCSGHSASNCFFLKYGQKFVLQAQFVNKFEHLDTIKLTLVKDFSTNIEEIEYFGHFKQGCQIRYENREQNRE